MNRETSVYNIINQNLMSINSSTVSLSDVTTPTIVEDRELNRLIIASIQTLKR